MELLNTASAKKKKRVLGLMSGTSLDGLDIALCRISGNGRDISVEMEKFVSVDYPESIRGRLLELRSASRVDLMELCIVNGWFGDYMGEMVNETLKRWNVGRYEVDLIASHGQTVYHAPRSGHQQAGMPNATLQIGDGDHLAAKTGILTMSDFRQKHTAFGGEGAPLAATVDYLLFMHETESRILLNIGGIANFTWLPASGNFKDVMTTDTGPGNTLIDSIMQHKFDQPFDDDGQTASKGNVDVDLLAALMDHPYFKLALPKTTGQELFNMEYVDKALSETGKKGIKGEDLITTLTHLTVESIAAGIRLAIPDSGKPVLYVSGGGAHNAMLMQWLSESLPEISVKRFADLGFDPDAKEAVLFAVLGYESLFGEGVPFMMEEKVRNIRLGKLSFPG